MRVRTYDSAAGFLLAAQEWLEQNEVANGLVLGICGRLRQGPSGAPGAAYLATVEDEAGPLVAAIMTPPYRAILTGGERSCPEALAAIARDLRAKGWHVPGVLAPAAIAGGFAAAWTHVAGGSAILSQHQRVYAMSRVDHPRYSPGHLRAATAADIPRLSAWLEAFHREVGEDGAANAEEMARRRVAGQDLYVWDDGGPVSMAGRTRPTTHGISIGPVYTPPETRRRGYATSCVASLSQALLDAGRSYCTLHTNLANPTSNDIYQKIGYRPVCDHDVYVFS